MLAISRSFACSFHGALLALGCRGSSGKKSDSSPAAYGCSIAQGVTLVLCIEYSNLSADALTKIQSNCQLKGNGYTWAATACTSTSRQANSCIFAATESIPAQGTQYFYGNAFSDEETRKGMCSGQGGSFQ